MKLIDANPLEKKGNDVIVATSTLILKLLSGKIPDDTLESIKQIIFSLSVMLDNSSAYQNNIIETINILNEIVQNNVAVIENEKDFLQSCVEFSLDQIKS